VTASTHPRLQARLLQFLALALAFLAGGLTEIWLGRRHPPPPPALRSFDEFRRPRPRDGRRPPRAELTPERMAELNRRLERMKPEMEVFRKRFDRIEDDFQAGLRAILRPAQLRREAELDAGEPDAEGYPDRPPPRRDERGSPGQPAEILRIVAFRPRLARLSQLLQLDEAQRKQLRVLLEERRARFIALVDELPPPSLELEPTLEGNPPPGRE